MKYRSIRPQPKLNLVPIMNLVTILIPVLLMALKSLELAVVQIDFPAISPSTPDPAATPLAITIAVTKQGINIFGADRYLYPSGAPADRDIAIPCPSNGCLSAEEYDWNSLRDKLVFIKREAQLDGRDSDNVILVSQGNLRFGGIVKLLDVTRDDPRTGQRLFPNAVFGTAL